MNEIIISFCVPSYNRAEMTVLMVNSILRYQGNDIEVIVTDDASPDNTIVKLDEIKDKRLRIIQNKSRLGGAGNMIESLRYSKGKYSFVAFSREEIDSKAIPELIELLRTCKYSIVYCGEDQKNHSNAEYKRGIPALRKLAYKSLHPTGMIFRTDYLNKSLKKYKAEECGQIFSFFPHDFIAADLAIENDILLYNKKVRIRVKEHYIKNSKSDNSAVNEKNKIIWFYPSGRVQQFEKHVAHLSKLNISEKEKAMALIYMYRMLLSHCTISYQLMAKDKLNCDHYNVPLKNVTFRSLLVIAGKTRNEFVRIAKKYKIKLNPMCLLLCCFPITEFVLMFTKIKIQNLILSGLSLIRGRR